MRGTWPYVVVGCITALAIGELVLRTMAPVMPPPSSWPTAEMELKSSQLRSLESEPDIVVIGSSTTESALDPELFAEVTGLLPPYNAAHPFSSLASNLVWLEEVVLANTSPSLVIIGVQPWAANPDNERRIERMHAAVDSGDSWLAELSMMIRSQGVLADWDSRRAREHLLSSGLWTTMGHFTGYYDRGSLDLDEWVPPSRAGSLDPDGEMALKELVDLVTASGANAVILVEPRCCHEGTDDGNGRYLSWLRARVESWEIEIWDTYWENWSSELFVDNSHFNRRGTEAYTKHVGQLVMGKTLGIRSED